MKSQKSTGFAGSVPASSDEEGVLKNRLLVLSSQRGFVEGTERRSLSAMLLEIRFKPGVENGALDINVNFIQEFRKIRQPILSVCMMDTTRQGFGVTVATADGNLLTLHGTFHAIQSEPSQVWKRNDNYL